MNPALELRRPLSLKPLPADASFVHLMAMPEQCSPGSLILISQQSTGNGLDDFLRHLLAQH